MDDIAKNIKESIWIDRVNQHHVYHSPIFFSFPLLISSAELVSSHSPLSVSPRFKSIHGALLAWWNPSLDAKVQVQITLPAHLNFRWDQITKRTFLEIAQKY